MPQPVLSGRGAAAVPREEWVVRGRSLSLSRPLVAGIVNVTPDSFSDGGRYAAPEDALASAERMLEEGADLLDVGGESTRPGAAPVPAEEEMARVLPVLRLLRLRLTAPLSVDTRRASVARAALAEGVEIVNDVSGFADPEMVGVVAGSGAGVVLMHMRGTPQTMQGEAHYQDVVADVAAELGRDLRRALDGGIAAERIVLDPGIGFAKTAEQNVELLARLDELLVLGRPLLVGVSRKAFLGALLGGVPPQRRDVATAAACAAALLRGARIFRVHHVRPVREALTVAEAIRAASPAPT